MNIEQFELNMAAIICSAIIGLALAIAVPITIYKIETEKYAIEHGYVQNPANGQWEKPK